MRSAHKAVNLKRTESSTAVSASGGLARRQLGNYERGRWGRMMCTVRKRGGSSSCGPLKVHAFMVYFTQQSCPERPDIPRQPSPHCSLVLCADAQRGHPARMARSSRIQRPLGMIWLGPARHSDTGCCMSSSATMSLRAGRACLRVINVLQET